MVKADSQSLRGDAGSYERYLRGMDASMRQKVALTAALLLCEGRVADMGCGSGAGSGALAGLYPGLQVLAVDLDPTMTAGAARRNAHPNLGFVIADIATPVFAADALDGIFDSSVLHHVTTFSGYDHDAARRALEAQASQLREHGVLIVRDFLAPPAGPVLLDLPDDDGDGTDDPRTCSTASLLERFAGEFRSLSEAPGFDYREVIEPCGGPPLAAGFRRFSLDHRHAVEFMLRKDYREDWEAEVREEYTYFTQAGFEAVFAELGLRVLASTPVRNPWIVRHRFEGRLALWDAAGRPLDWPATNYLIAGERVPAMHGIGFEETEEVPAPGFLRRERFRRDDGSVWDLVRRPNPTLDILPWFEDGGVPYVLARMSYPRPILQSPAGSAAPLDGSRPAGYVSEPLNAILADKPLGQTVAEALWQDAHIAESQIRRFTAGVRYYPSPGGILEEVESVLVEIEPVMVRKDLVPRSGFSTSGRVRAIEARQLLRSAQVGGLSEARLELNAHHLLRSRGRSLGPWIGEEIEPVVSPPPHEIGVAELFQRPGRRAYTTCAGSPAPPFLERRCCRFAERNAAGEVLAEGTLEYVVPIPVSSTTVSVALLRRSGGRLWMAVDDDDLPAAQSISGNSHLPVAPAWRLPFDVRGLAGARDWILDRVRRDYGLHTGRHWELGGPYHPSPGLTPEVVHPLAVEVTGETGAGERDLLWVDLSDLVRHRHLIRDGHLMITSLRASHACADGESASE